jgi:hypothetical protein
MAWLPSKQAPYTGTTDFWTEKPHRTHDDQTQPGLISPFVKEQGSPHENYHSMSMLNPPLRLRKLIALSSHRAEVSGEGWGLL